MRALPLTIAGAASDIPPSWRHVHWRAPDPDADPAPHAGRPGLATASGHHHNKDSLDAGRVRMAATIDPGLR